MAVPLKDFDLDDIARELSARMAEEILQERRDKWARAERDFLYFASLLSIVNKAGNRAPLAPNAIQLTFEAVRTLRDIVLKPRQIGFTTWELARDLWFFLFRPSARVVIVVQSSSDHAGLLDTNAKLRVMFESLRVHGFDLPFRTESISEWHIGDASLRIVEAGASEAAASKKGRSGTIHRLHITELAFFEFAQTTLNAILECVPSEENGSEIVIESTANGAAGMFYERWNSARRGNGYKPHFFKWMDDSTYRVTLGAGETVEPITERERQISQLHGGTPEQVKWYRQKVEDKGQDLVDQEYPLDENTCWLVAGRLFFDRERCIELRGRTTEPIRISLGGDLRIWREPQPNQNYVVAVDPSEGTGGDPGGAMVYDRETGEHCATLHGQFPVWVLGDHAAKLGERYNWALIVVERNNHGPAVIQSLERPSADSGRKRYPNIAFGRDGKLGWWSSEVSRTAALDALEDAHRRGAWSSPDKDVVAEMLLFVVTKNGKAEAAPGAHDDLVMCAAIGWDICTRAKQSSGGVAPPVEPLLPFDERPLFQA